MFLDDLIKTAPEIVILTFACLILLLGAFLPKKLQVYTYYITQLGLVFGVCSIFLTMTGTKDFAFNALFIRDNLSDLLKIISQITLLFVFLYSKKFLLYMKILSGEYFCLGLFGLLGIMIMISGNNLITLYLGLELLSLSLYTMIAFVRDSSVASESAMKYFVLGSLASGVLLYGFSLLYGVTHTLEISSINSYLMSNDMNQLQLVFSLVFILSGLAFKLGAVPFHMWLPDVYEGSPTSVTLYISAIPKIAGVALLLRVLGGALPNMYSDWHFLLIFLAVLSLTFGNIIAIAQNNIKRMLAYSAISHTGFILLGVLSGADLGYSSAVFYVIVYSIMVTAVFGIILLLSSKNSEMDLLRDFQGLAHNSPWLAFLMLIIMFSMAGIPLTAGFYAKLFVLHALIDAGLIWLAVYAVIFTVVGAYYYLRVVWYMYFEKPQAPIAMEPSFVVSSAVSVNTLLLLILFIFPQTLLGICVVATNF
jgi:NADH-quinone oxidoreductase subunit N